MKRLTLLFAFVATSAVTASAQTRFFSERDLDPWVPKYEFTLRPTSFSANSRGSGVAPSKPDAILASGSWNADAGDNWSNSARWLGGVIADGAGATGNFTFNITANRTITINGGVASRTLGIMNIGDTDGTDSYTIAASGGGTLTFDNSGSNAQINQTSTSDNNTISAPIVLNSSLDITNASANALTFATGGGITAGTAGTKTITTSTGLVTISGVIGNGSGTVAITQNGPGTLTLTNAGNTYSGDTTINGGRISVDADATLGNGAGTLFLSGGALDISANRGAGDDIANNISLTADSSIITTSNASNVNVNFSGTLTGSAGTLTIENVGANAAGDTFTARFSGGTFTMSRPIVLTGGTGQVLLTDFNVAGTTHTYNGVISGNGSYTRDSTTATGGTTIFNAANTYTGATAVDVGTLLVNGSTSASSAVTVNGSGSTLGGTGTIGGAVTVNSGGKITGATNGTVGTLTLSSTATFTGASGNLATYLVDLSGATSDKLAISSTLSLSGTFDQISFSGAANGTTTYVLATYSSVSGTFNTVTGLPSGYQLIYGATELDLAPIPEPSTWIGAVLAVGLLGWTQRKRFFRKAETLRS
jgi:autotransporter-associated beta strand protein